MQKSLKPTETPRVEVPDLDLPLWPECARRPPVLTMEQYFALNESDALDFGSKPVVTLMERCLVPFEM